MFSVLLVWWPAAAMRCRFAADSLLWLGGERFGTIVVVVADAGSAMPAIQVFTVIPLS